MPWRYMKWGAVGGCAVSVILLADDFVRRPWLNYVRAEQKYEQLERTVATARAAATPEERRKFGALFESVRPPN